TNKSLMGAIQQRLLRDGAFLLGTANEDPLDLAKNARIRASSEQIIGLASNIISGRTRCVHGRKGAPMDRANPGTHRWMSDPDQSLPAWLELNWEEPKAIREIQLTFDTGLHRVLTFSLADDYTRKMLWGQPQPETV